MTLWIKTFKGFDDTQTVITAKFEFLTSNDKTLLEIIKKLNIGNESIEQTIKETNTE